MKPKGRRKAPSRRHSLGRGPESESARCPWGGTEEPGFPGSVGKKRLERAERARTQPGAEFVKARGAGRDGAASRVARPRRGPPMTGEAGSRGWSEGCCSGPRGEARLEPGGGRGQGWCGDWGGRGAGEAGAVRGFAGHALHPWVMCEVPSVGCGLVPSRRAEGPAPAWGWHSARTSPAAPLAGGFPSGTLQAQRWPPARPGGAGRHPLPARFQSHGRSSSSRAHVSTPVPTAVRLGGRPGSRTSVSVRVKRGC